MIILQGKLLQILNSADVFRENDNKRKEKNRLS